MAEFDSIHEQIEAERKAAIPNPEIVNKHRAYAGGRQRSTLGANHARILRGLLGNLFCDNICRMVLEAIASRLKLVRYDVSSANAEAARAKETFLETLWTKNKLGALAHAVNIAALRDGRHGVSLSWRPGKTAADGDVRLTRERAWNGKNGLFVALDAQDEPTYAVKEWKQGNDTFRTIWRPEKIERYRADGSGWKLYNLRSDPVDGTKSPAQAVPWVDRTGAPLGIPVVQFANTVMPLDGEDENGKQADSRQGDSTLGGGVEGLQDEINDIHRDVTAAARMTAYQIPYGTGVTLEIGPDGKEIPLKVEPGTFVTVSEKEARLGVMAAGSLAELERALTIKLQAVSRMTGVPMHVITGTWPSGAALLQAEMTLIELAESLGEIFGPDWASVGHKATRIASTFGGQALDPDAMITAVFAPVSRRDPLTNAQVAVAEAPFVSIQETLRTLGRSPKEIERILKEKEEEQARFNPQAGIELQRSQLALQSDQTALAQGGSQGIADRLRQAATQ